MRFFVSRPKGSRPPVIEVTRTLGEIAATTRARPDRIADKLQPSAGHLSSACKRGAHARGCASCSSLRCACACHGRCAPSMGGK